MRLQMNRSTLKSIKRNPRFKAVFVLGARHSGVSLLTSLLSKYYNMNRVGLSQFSLQFRPAVYLNDAWDEYAISEERLIDSIIQNLLPETFKDRLNLSPNTKEIFKRLQKKDLEGVFEVLMESAIGSQGNAEYCIDTVHRYSSAEFLKEAFPSGRFIHIIRDGRDIALTDFRFPGNLKNWAFSALKWKHGIDTSLQFSQSLPQERFAEVRYEDLLSAPQIVLERLRNFLGISDKKGKIRQRINCEVQNDLPLDYPAMWKRRLSLQDRIAFERVAAEELARYGYETFTQSAQLPRLIEPAFWDAPDHLKSEAEILAV